MAYTTLTRFCMLIFLLLAACTDFVVCLFSFNNGLNPLFAQNAGSPNIFGKRPTLNLGWRSERDHLLNKALHDLESRAFVKEVDDETRSMMTTENNLFDMELIRARQNEVDNVMRDKRRLLLKRNLDNSELIPSTTKMQQTLLKSAEATSAQPPMNTKSIMSKNRKTILPSNAFAKETFSSPSTPVLPGKEASLSDNGRDEFLNIFKNIMKMKSETDLSSNLEKISDASRNVPTGKENMIGNQRKRILHELMNIVANGNDRDFLRFLLKIFLRKLMQDKRRDKETFLLNKITAKPSSTETLIPNSFAKPRVQNSRPLRPNSYTILESTTTPLYMLEQTDSGKQHISVNLRKTGKKTAIGTMKLKPYTSYVTHLPNRFFKPRQNSKQSQTSSFVTIRPTTPLNIPEGLDKKAQYRVTNYEAPFQVTPSQTSTVGSNEVSHGENIKDISKNRPSAVENVITQTQQRGNGPIIQSIIQSEFNWISNDNKPRTYKGVSEIKVNANIQELNTRTLTHSLNTSIHSNPISKRFDLKMNHSFQV